MTFFFDMSECAYDMKRLWDGKRPHESDFYFFGKIMAPADCLFLDVGANSGQSALSFCMNCPGGRVISFEPNSLYEPILREIRESILGATRFSFFIEGCSDRTTTETLIVPVVNGVPYMQEATTDRAQFSKPWVVDRLASYGKDLTFSELTIHVEPLDSHSLQPNFVKIDAEGGELAVLRGMKKTIHESLPIFLIENNDYHNVTPYLTEFGYNPYVWDAQRDLITLMTDPTTNCFYLRDDQFRQYVVPTDLAKA